MHTVSLGGLLCVEVTPVYLSLLLDAELLTPFPGGESWFPSHLWDVTWQGFLTSG